jgi:hypothetical protein
VHSSPEVQRPADPRPRVLAEANPAAGGVVLVDLAVVGPLDAQVEASVSRQREVCEGEQQVPRHRVHVLERQLARELALGIEAARVEYPVRGEGRCGQHDQREYPTRGSQQTASSE